MVFLQISKVFIFCIVFYMVSGLQINLHKLNIYGTGVLFVEVEQFSLVTGCKAANLPFVYVCILVGAVMSRVTCWMSISDRFVKKFSYWKVKMMSICGRFHFFEFCVGFTWYLLHVLFSYVWLCE